MSTNELTLLHKLREIKDEKPNHEALVSYNQQTGRQAITFSDFHTLCRRFAFVLKEEAGVKPGDYVVMTLPVSIETSVATFGIVLAGAVPASLQITWKNGNALVACLERLKANLILIKDSADDDVLSFFKSGLTSRKGANGLARVSWEGLPNLANAYLVTRGGNADFLTKLKKAKDEYEYENIHGKMSAFMHLTTGAITDRIKLTEMSHEAAVRYCDSMQSHFIKPFTKFLYLNGWFWICGMPFDILQGVTRCIPDDWVPCENFPKLLYNFIKSENIQFADIPPAIAQGIMDAWKADQAENEPLLDALVFLGMPIAKRMLQVFRPLCKAFILVYGSHECGANHSNVVHSSQVDTFTDFDCGLPMPGVESKIVDEHGQEVPLGEKGRLLLKTPGMFVGYPNQPERTAAMFNKDGWFVTNDEACYDKTTKHLMVGGRIDSLILHGEYMIHPSWIEEMVGPHPSVQHVISVPVRDDVLFHAIGVCVIKKPGCELTVSDVNVRIGKSVIPSAVPLFQVKHLMFFDDFPLRADGKVDRSRMFDLVHDRVWKKQAALKI